MYVGILVTHKQHYVEEILRKGQGVVGITLTIDSYEFGGMPPGSHVLCQATAPRITHTYTHTHTCPHAASSKHYHEHTIILRHHTMKRVNVAVCPDSGCIL